MWFLEESDADKAAQQLQSVSISASSDAGGSDASAVPSGASKMSLLAPFFFSIRFVEMDTSYSDAFFFF